MARIRKLLVANRGEIAVRIIRAARDANIPSVAVYSDQDRDALHARLADEAYALRGATAADTYLVISKLLSIARRSGANAVHPGYGFLAERADFARAVEEAGLIWVGPSPESIELLGDKVSARRIARKVGAPLAEGTPGPVADVDEVEAFGRRHGFPLAIKAAYGGGGRGMRVVRDPGEVAYAFESATREAVAAFGRGECFVEQFLERPRHVETQCLADGRGHVVVVSTRDCSLQRRNQKLVEEAPAPFLSEAQHHRLASASKAILAEAGYAGAGTCEFLVARDGSIAFLEVNTRLQVEHTVSEAVTGFDLVREQFRIAEGGAIGYDDPDPRGHAFEFRINGEDAGRGFMPQPGVIKTYHEPAGPGVRVDSGVREGDAVTGAFDSLLAKLIVWGATREEALERSRRALAEYEVTGLPTVLPFDRDVVSRPEFVAADGHFGVHTRWIETDYDNAIEPWSGEAAPVPALAPRRTLTVEVNDKRIEVSLPERLLATAGLAPHAPGTTMRGEPPRRRVRGRDAVDATSDGAVKAPMQATVVKYAVENGQEVVPGDLLLVLEAMKMEQPIAAAHAGVVRGIGVEPGSTVPAGTVLLEVDPAAEPALA